MEEVIEFGAVEDGVMSEVVLQPTSLCLAGDHKASWCKPGEPVVPKVPEDPPGQNVQGNDMSKQSNKEPHLNFEHALQDGD